MKLLLEGMDCCRHSDCIRNGASIKRNQDKTLSYHSEFAVPAPRAYLTFPRTHTHAACNASAGAETFNGAAACPATIRILPCNPTFGETGPLAIPQQQHL